jgi:hypothetical protein
MLMTNGRYQMEGGMKDGRWNSSSILIGPGVASAAEEPDKNIEDKK